MTRELEDVSGTVELEAELRAGLADFYMAGQWSVVSDHPALAIACGGYRVVQTANQNNFRHFGPSERWIGIESYGAANHIARCSPDNILTILDTIATLRSERDTLLAQVARVERVLCDLDPENAIDDSLLRDVHARLQVHGEKYPDRAVSVLHRNVVFYTIQAAVRVALTKEPS